MHRINLKNSVKRQLLSFFDIYLSKDKVLFDVGCGTKPFAQDIKGRVKEHIGVDLDEGFYDKEHIDIIGSAYDVPVDDGAADIVLSSQVLEHLETPELAIAETARLLKKDGIFICSFPFLYPLHAVPFDFHRISEFAMEKYLKDHNMEPIEMKRVGGFWYIVGMYFEMYLQTFDRGILQKLKIIKVISWLFAWAFTLIHGLEGLVIGKLGGEKALATARDRWTVNYIMVARKK